MDNTIRTLTKTFKKNLKIFKVNYPELSEPLRRSSNNVEFLNKYGKLYIKTKSKEIDIDSIHSYYNNITENLHKHSITFRLFESKNIQGFGISAEYLKLLKNKTAHFIDPKTEEKKNNYIPILIIFEENTGYLIEKLIDNYEIDHLFILGKNISTVKYSVHLANWQKIFKYFSEKRKSINFIFNDNPKVLANKTILKLSDSLSPPAAIKINFLNASFIEPNNEFLATFIKEFKEEFSMTNSFLGFFDDELLSIKHTEKNIVENKIFLFDIKNSKEKLKNINNTPIFICGSGPSLDKLIDIIKHNKENVIIVSCGTALKALLEYNIIPDFHFEMERCKITYDLLKLINKEILEKMNFIGLNVLFPNVFNLFNTKCSVIKYPDTCSEIFSDKYLKLNFSNPTVTNMALSFFSHLSFKNIYLFGVDYGFWETKKHHSKKTIYYSKDKNVEFKSEHIKIDGNFSHKITTTSIFLYSKKITEIIIRNFPQTKVYNPNFGAKIEGAITIEKEKITISNHKNIDKLTAIEIIKNQFQKLDKEEITVLSSKLIEVINDAIIFNKSNLKLVEKRKKDIKTLSEIYFLAKEIHSNLSQLSFKNHGIFTMLRGSYYHFIRTIINASWQIKDEDFKSFISVTLQLLTDFIEEMNKELNKLKLSFKTNS